MLKSFNMLIIFIPLLLGEFIKLLNLKPIVVI